MVFLGRLLRSARSVPGRQFIGKHRKVKKSSGQSISNTLKWKALQRDNEAVLSQPFLTQDEEKGSAIEKKAKLREELKMSRLLRRTATKSVSSEVVQRLKQSL
jgi:hypothetical protein